MSTNSFTQKLIPTMPSIISLTTLSSNKALDLINIVRDLKPPILGLSAQTSDEGQLCGMAFATTTAVFYISTGQSVVGAGKFKTSSHNGLSSVLCGDAPLLCGFWMSHTALNIYRELRCNVHAIELFDLDSSSRPKWSPAKLVEDRVSNKLDSGKINSLWNPDGGSHEVCLRAWISACVAEKCIQEVHRLASVDTSILEAKVLHCLGTIVKNTERLDAANPRRRESEISAIEGFKGGEVTLRNSRYKTRMRKNDQATVVIETSHGSFEGRVVGAEGKNTTVEMKQGKFSGEVKSVYTVGRQQLTFAEKAKESFILHVLQGKADLYASTLIKAFWFYSDMDLDKPFSFSTHSSSAISSQPSFSAVGLNPSQCRVVDAMLSDHQEIVIAHGPPGTGKTHTISAAVKEWGNRPETFVWIIAHSNIGVKNIARSLFRRKVNFKLIVSKEFYHEWHEHIYTDVLEFLIRSDDLFSDGEKGVYKVIGSSRIILCTLSMLSNPAMDTFGLFKLVPVERLIVDEASQIDAYDFMHLFYKFSRLQKLCLFGDPKQLPPFGQDTVHTVKSVFELRHLQSCSYFLDTQYRMPVPLGDFISKEVYESKLYSEHWNTDVACVSFVDVTKGREQKVGSGWTNPEEVHTIVNLIQHYYRGLKFCVITPYDAQRAAIQKRLEDENLPWQRVFNVDSFQGHDEDYVIISTVRTTVPGFLTVPNRMNVMLTRCKKAMVIVTNRTFLQTPAAQRTLLGKLARYLEQQRGVEKPWVDSRKVVERTAYMPGAGQPQTSLLVRTATFSVTSYNDPPVPAVTISSSPSASLNGLETASPIHILQPANFPPLPTSTFYSQTPNPHATVHSLWNKVPNTRANVFDNKNAQRSYEQSPQSSVQPPRSSAQPLRIFEQPPRRYEQPPRNYKQPPRNISKAAPRTSVRQATPSRDGRNGIASPSYSPTVLRLAFIHDDFKPATSTTKREYKPSSQNSSTSIRSLNRFTVLKQRQL